MKFDFSKFQPTNTFYVEVNLDEPKTFVTEGGVELYHPDKEGDMYQNKVFWGILRAAPNGSRIPLGSKVYMDYHAMDTLAKTENGNFYIPTKNNIIRWDDNAFECILVEPIKEDKKGKILTDVSEDDMFDAVAGKAVKESPTTKAKVVAVDEEWLKSQNLNIVVGDIIEYSDGIDWEYIVNRTTHYYIKWVDKILRVNGELVNTFNEFIPQPKHITTSFGLVIPNTEKFCKVVDGKFKGKWVLPQKGRIEIGKYVKDEWVMGELIKGLD